MKPGDASILRSSLAECVDGFAMNSLLLLAELLSSSLLGFHGGAFGSFSGGDLARSSDAAGLRAGAHG